MSKYLKKCVFRKKKSHDSLNNSKRQRMTDGYGKRLNQVIIRLKTVIMNKANELDPNSYDGLIKRKKKVIILAMDVVHSII